MGAASQLENLIGFFNFPSCRNAAQELVCAAREDGFCILLVENTFL